MNRQNEYIVGAQKKQIIQSLEKGSTIIAACKAAKICYATYFNWFKADQKFAEQINEAELAKVQAVEGSMFKRAMGYEVEEVHTTYKGNQIKVKKHIPADVAAQVFITCNLMPEKYRNVQRVDTNSKVTQEVSISDEDRVLLRQVAESITRNKAGIK